MHINCIYILCNTTISVRILIVGVAKERMPHATSTTTKQHQQQQPTETDVARGSVSVNQTNSESEQFVPFFFPIKPSRALLIIKTFKTQGKHTHTSLKF